jgi:hypothetical protein
MRKLFLFLILAVVVAICAAGPAKAEVTSNEKVPFDAYFLVPCANNGAGEIVHLTGFLHTVLSYTFNNNNYQSSYHFQPMGVSGEGLTTGDKYQATGVTRADEEASFAGFPFNTTYVNNFRIIGQGPGNNYLVHENVHITVNANGETTVTVDNFKVDCK